MDDTVEQSLKEIGHSISCLHTNSGDQLDDIFRLRHLFPYSKFVNDMRGLSINLSNFFSAYAPRLDSFLIGPVKPTVSETTVSYADKILVADLLNVGKADDTLNRWKQLKREFNKSTDALVHKENVSMIVDAHNELLQQLVNRSLEFGMNYTQVL
ncbi:mediator complex subunit MED8, putative [Babesia ovis]|uniref:Mediator complex subunit MED8, putative n=1 Tax=Babesia ovis TaxID=5869 RepID=A0A9W5WTT0_BABOV|nr:mediator complex subunit MED8, putative [Babesia ovis]